MSLSRRQVRQRRARWALLGAAVIVLIGGASALVLRLFIRPTPSFADWFRHDSARGQAHLASGDLAFQHNAILSYHLNHSSMNESDIAAVLEFLRTTHVANEDFATLVRQILSYTGDRGEPMIVKGLLSNSDAAPNAAQYLDIVTRVLCGRDGRYRAVFDSNDGAPGVHYDRVKLKSLAIDGALLPKPDSAGGP